jgi:hypothetical protein
VFKPTTSRMNSHRVPASAVAAGLAVAAWFGVLLQFWLSIRLVLANGQPVISGLVAFFGYFTVLTNIFVALVCTAGSLRQHARGRLLLYRLPFVGCSTAAILVVGIGYHALLREIWDPRGAQWVDVLTLGYIQSVINAVGFLIGFVVLGFALLGLSSLVSRLKCDLRH